MPPWAQTLIWLAGAVGAAGVLWAKVIRPLVRAVTLAERMLPLLADLTKQFEGTPGAFATLNAIAEQFRPNAGDSLRDVINRVEASVRLLAGKADTLEKRDEEDRTRAARTSERVDQVAAKVELQGEAAGERAKAIEKLTAKVEDVLPSPPAKEE